MAAREFGTAYIYFDANNNVVGNVVLQYSCPGSSSWGSSISCDVGPGGIVICSTAPNPDYKIDTANIQYFHSASGLTAADFCSPHNPGQAFYGAPQCNLPGSAELGILDPYEEI